MFVHSVFHSRLYLKGCIYVFGPSDPHSQCSIHVCGNELQWAFHCHWSIISSKCFMVFIPFPTHSWNFISAVKALQQFCGFTSSVFSFLNQISFPDGVPNVSIARLYFSRVGLPTPFLPLDCELITLLNRSSHAFHHILPLPLRHLDYVRNGTCVNITENHPERFWIRRRSPFIPSTLATNYEAPARDEPFNT